MFTSSRPTGTTATRGGTRSIDRRPPLRVARRRHDSRRLVEQHVSEPLLRDRRPVDLDAVVRAPTNVFSCPHAVDGDAARLDQLVGLAPRRDPGAGEIGVQTHARYCPRMPHYITLMRWTSQGIAGLPGWRERVEEGERIIDEAGGTLVGVYVTIGHYDVVEIFEAPDDEVAIEILMKLSASGPSTPRRSAPSRATRPKRSSGASELSGCQPLSQERAEVGEDVRRRLEGRDVADARPGIERHRLDLAARLLVRRRRRPVRNLDVAPCPRQLAGECAGGIQRRAQHAVRRIRPADPEGLRQNCVVPACREQQLDVAGMGPCLDGGDEARADADSGGPSSINSATAFAVAMPPPATIGTSRTSAPAVTRLRTGVVPRTWPPASTPCNVT